MGIENGQFNKKDEKEVQNIIAPAGMEVEPGYLNWEINSLKRFSFLIIRDIFQADGLVQLLICRSLWIFQFSSIRLIPLWL